MRWWGWGEDGHAVQLPPVAENMLRDQLGVDPAASRPPVGLEQVSVPDSRLPGAARERLAAATLLGALPVLHTRTLPALGIERPRVRPAQVLAVTR